MGDLKLSLHIPNTWSFLKYWTFICYVGLLSQNLYHLPLLNNVFPGSGPTLPIQADSQPKIGLSSFSPPTSVMCIFANMLLIQSSDPNYTNPFRPLFCKVFPVNSQHAQSAFQFPWVLARSVHILTILTQV